MKISYRQLVEHYQILKADGWNRDECLDGGLELDSDEYIDPDDELDAIGEAFDYDPTPCCYQHGVGAISTDEPCPKIADND